ncbi:uncharacterized protein [Typha latifolia]|uniref:uncharacterized protein isoform X1 n=1 Tax=Typha latifolia TaxID=4733 RepID=UPI003C30E55B
MGSSGSKLTNDEALVFCKERIQYIKQAVDARYALSAAHLSYIRSLRSVGTALRRFTESELLLESSLSTSEVDKSPSPSSYASPSPPHIVEHVDSPFHGASPFSMNYMRTTGGGAVTVTINPSAAHFVEQESLGFGLPSPPLPPVISSSWDFFDPTDGTCSVVSHNGESGLSLNYSRMKGLKQLREVEVVPLIEAEMTRSYEMKEEPKMNNISPSIIDEKDEAKQLTSKHRSVDGLVDALTRIAASELHESKIEKDDLEKELCAEREDASEFITHRAKDFLSSMKDIEHRFLRASEAGNEASRMLETNKIRLNVCSDMEGKSPNSSFLEVFQAVCCKGKIATRLESTSHVKKVITWNRSISSLSSSSKNPLTLTEADDCGDSSDFIEEFSMLSGSHSSALDRLYAWERKLYDEIKASEYIRKAYDQKCSQLRHQFAQDLNAQVIDKTRAVVKDLHSRVCVAIQAVDSVSKRIEKLRDEELQPQIVELLQGLIRMWKAMLECHHAQFITISLAYHVKSSSAAPASESRRQAMVLLCNEMDCFASSFQNWVTAHKSYLQALNSWLQKCVLQPQERRKGRKVAFPPRQALSPPIFVLCSNWLTGLASVPAEELCNSIKDVISVLHESFAQQVEENKVKEDSENTQDCGDLKNNEYEKLETATSFSCLQTSLVRLFDRLTRVSELSLKVHEDAKQATEMACMAYSSVGIR